MMMTGNAIVQCELEQSSEHWLNIALFFIMHSRPSKRVVHRRNEHHSAPFII